MTVLKKIPLFLCAVMVFALSFLSPVSAAVFEDDYEGEYISESGPMLYSGVSTFALTGGTYSALPESSSTPFGLTDAIKNNSSFLYAEDLPYGTNSLVFAFRIAHVLYFFIVDSTVDCEVYYSYNENNADRFTISVVSYSPIWRVGYNRNTGAYITFGGAKGLAVTTDEFFEGSDSYGLMYNISVEGDMYCTIGSNSAKFINNYEQEYLIATYPTKESAELDTQKGIWQTLKDLPGNIANSIKGFFTSLGDRISGFFEGLKTSMLDYFTRLKNYLLYFQAEKPSDEQLNPFNGILSGVQSFFDEQIESVESFKNGLNSALNNVVSYIETGTTIFNQFFIGVPLIAIFVTFFIIFAVVRKVVGN